MRCITGFGSPTDSPPIAMPVQGPRSRVPSSERMRSSSWMPPWMMGQRVCGRVCLSRQLRVPCLTAIQPAKRSLHSLAGGLGRGLRRHDVVKGHRNVGPQLPLDLDRTLGREGPMVPSIWLWNSTPSSAMRRRPSSEKTWNPPESVSIGTVPGGEPVEPAHGLDHRLARPEVQMVGVAQDDLGAGAADVSGAESSNHGMGAHRHECRGLHLPMRQGESAGAGRARSAVGL